MGAGGIMAYYPRGSYSKKASPEGGAGAKPGRKPSWRRQDGPAKAIGKAPRFTPPGGWNEQFQAGLSLPLNFLNHLVI